MAAGEGEGGEGGEEGGGAGGPVSGEEGGHSKAGEGGGGVAGGRGTSNISCEIFQTLQCNALTIIARKLKLSENGT